MANPRVSVIVPMYNVEIYIKTCVDSILAQTFQDFEIILVDDASSDKCVEICRELYGDNPKIKIVRHEKNLGLGSARNTGMKHAVGKYIYFVDSDDLILPQTLEKFFDAAEKNNADVVHAAGFLELYQDEPYPIIKENLTLIGEKYNVEGFLKKNLYQRLYENWREYSTTSMAWLVFCRRKFLEKNNIQFLPIISEDEPFNFALLYLTDRYYIIRDALYIYRRRNGSIMKTQNLKRLRQGIQALFIGSAYIEKFLDKAPRFEGYDSWRQAILNEFFRRFLDNHVVPNSVDLDKNPEKHALITEMLAPVFGENYSFVRFFFNGFNALKHTADSIWQQRQMLLQENYNLKNLTANFIAEQPALLKLMTSIKSDTKKIFLLGTPQHGNLGDHAIVWGEMKILRDTFPDREIIEIPYDYLTGEFGELLFGLGVEKYIRRTELIAYHGGGNLGNLWVNEEQLRRRIIEKFPDNKIVIFPQSIYFTEDDNGRGELTTSQKIYNTHRNLHLMTRDENSFAFAKNFFPKVNNYLLPDAATVLQGVTDDLDDERAGVLFILRSDKEKVRNDGNIKYLQNYFTANNIPFAVTDTVIGGKVTAKNREQKIREVLIKIRRSKLVVTDRFHGVIFSFITRTPVLAFKSFDTKISSGIKWFRNLPTILYAGNQEWVSVENFIRENYFAVTEKNSAALNCKLETDSEERFFRALDKIVRANKIYSLESSTLRLPATVDFDTSRRLTVDTVNVFEKRILFKYHLEGDWKNFLNVNTEFFIEYSEDISRTPKDIAVIPFLSNVLPIAWILNAEIVISELDNDFYEKLPQIKQGYVDMYPQIKFGGKLTVGKLISHEYEVSNETAAFFSGGADSFETLIAHAEEHPVLVTLLGSDVKLSDRKGWEIVRNHVIETAKQFQCKNLFIASSFRLFLNEAALSQLVMPLVNDGWWHGFQHGIGIISHIAPYAYLHKLKNIYFAASFTSKYKTTCASDPTIDNHVCIGKCTTIHDGYEFSRQDKIRRICDFKRRTGMQIQLRVCWQSTGGQNCCACEKCYRTICGILAEGENPADFSFSAYSLEKMCRDLQTPNFIYGFIVKFWRDIQNRFREKPENLPKELAWLIEKNF